jgi:hypothetical protein
MKKSKDLFITSKNVSTNLTQSSKVATCSLLSGLRAINMTAILEVTRTLSDTPIGIISKSAMEIN